MLQFASTYDSTWDNVDILKWSVIEVFLACICGNLMALRPLVDKAIPTIRSAISPYPRGPRQTYEKSICRAERIDTFVSSKKSSGSECTELHEIARKDSKDDDEMGLVSR